MAIMKTGMMRPHGLAALALAAGVFMMGLGGLACAESERLTQSSVKRFIASYPEVKTIAVNQAATKGKTIGRSDNALLAVVEAASDDKIKGEIDTTARRHGFRDSKEWFGVARSVSIAYAHIKTGTTDDAKTQKKLEKAIAKVEDMPLLSEKQKKQLVENIRKGAAALEPPPPENVALVKAMQPQIEAVVK
jgi:hypothetical protein